MAIDLLRVLARGAWPLTMECWNWVPGEEADGAVEAKLKGRAGDPSPRLVAEEKRTRNKSKAALVRNPEGLALLSDDAVAFDGFTALQQWGRQYGSILDSHGRLLYGRAPFTDPTAPPIAALFRVFAEGKEGDPSGQAR